MIHHDDRTQISHMKTVLTNAIDNYAEWWRSIAPEEVFIPGIHPNGIEELTKEHTE